MLCVFYSFFILNVLGARTSVSAEENVQINISRRTQDLTSDLLQSFTKFAEKIRKFFKLPFTKIENRRQLIKKAFFKYLQETVQDVTCETSDTKIQQNLIFVHTISAQELMKTHGYISEPHKVITTDGYILTLYRVFSNSTAEMSKNKIALLFHGLLGSSDDWVILGPKKALPYLLLDDGFDVWLANARGNKYSRAHMSKNVDSTEFWDFSWHEIGQFDLSAAIDYIRIVTEGKSQIDFIGHSLGCTALLVLLSTSPQYNYILRSATFLGPLAFMYQTTGLLKLLADFQSNYGITGLNFLGETEFMPDEMIFPRQVIQRYCLGDHMLCLNPWLLIANGGLKIFDEIVQEHVLSFVPAGTSTKTIKHYAQSVISGQFQMFDLGPADNLKKYGNKSPPIYRINDVTLPVVIFSSSSDKMSTIPDVLSLLPNIPNPVVHHIIKKHGFSHTDFVWAEDAPQLLYHLIIGSVGAGHTLLISRVADSWHRPLTRHVTKCHNVHLHYCESPKPTISVGTYTLGIKYI